MRADLERRAALARELLREAGAQARARAGGRARLSVERKGPQDFVTAVDRELEGFVRAELARAFPEDGFLGEEGGGSLGARGWVLDPVDGTANFLRGLPYWSITLACVEDGRPLLGWVYDPVHDELFEARAGEGAFRDGERIRISPARGPGEACIGLSFTFAVPRARYVGLIDGLLEAGFDHRRMGPAAPGLAHVADGRMEGMVFLRANIWDVLAGLLLVREAGGVTTDPAAFGTPPRPAPVFAAAPGIAPALEGVVARALAAAPEPS